MTRRNRTRVAALALAALTVTSFTACSSSSTGPSNSGEPSGSSGSSGSSDLASFAKAVDQFRKGSPSTFSGPTDPAAPPPGIKLAVIPCDTTLSGCEQPAKGAENAGKKIGWSVTEYNGASNPRTENQAILNALAAKSDAIITVSVDTELVKSGLAAAKQAGVPVVSISNGLGSPNPPGDLGGYAVDVSVDYVASGKAIADWIINDSGGDAHLYVMGDKEFHSVMLTQQGILNEMKKCSGCTVDPVGYFSASQLSSSVPQQTTGYLQTHPEVDYIYSPFDPAAAVQVPAIAAAGLANKVKLVSIVGAPQNLDFIKNGKVQVADVAEGNDYLGWAGVDQTIRLLTHKPLAEPNGENDPFVLLDKTNLPPPGQTWKPPFDYTASFLKLWGKS